VNAQRWGVIGTGTISRTVVSDLQSCDGAEVVIVQSRDVEKANLFAEEFGIAAATGSIEELLADSSIDAVYIATPFATHHAIARQALLADKHVLVEKPLAMNAAEVEDLFALAAERGIFLMEAMWMKFNPAFRRLHAEIAAGRIGDPKSVRASFGIPQPPAMESRWDIARSGGSLLDQGIYPVTLAYSVFGAPLSVHAAGETREDGLDLAQHFTLEFSEGRFAQCASSMTTFYDLSAAVSGTEGWIALPGPFWARTKLQVHAGDTATIFHSPMAVELEREGNGYVPMLREVIAAIRAGVTEHPVHPAADTVAVFRILDAIRGQLVAPAG
jgi:predicted dehydrogenase